MLWLVAALPWIALPAFLLWRARGGTLISEYAPHPGESVPASPDGVARVSVILPARNEAAHIEECLKALLASTHPSFEVLVVDDHSTDGTGALARRAAAGDPRVTVLDAPDLPDGWFGKQWACHTAVQVARGEILLFTDADTRHGPDLLLLADRALDARGADLLSVMGRQVLGTFWERLLQPQVFLFIFARYGGLETMSRSTDPLDKIANGQFLMVRRTLYDKVGGHAAVRDHVGEDMRLAQEVCRAGGVVHFVDARDHLSTRMYEGLRALLRGWAKNVYAAGRDAIDAGPVVHALVRIGYPLPVLWNVWPVLLAVVAAIGVLPPPVLWWGVTCYAASVVFWMAMLREFDVPAWYAVIYPVGALATAALFAVAAWRGDRVEWKGREYRSVRAVNSAGRTPGPTP